MRFIAESFHRKSFTMSGGSAAEAHVAADDVGASEAQKK
jgi:hypothetical protein